MSETLYAPPEAEVAVVETDGPEYYVVGTRKFLLLSILTLNIYLVYWSYLNWSIIKKRTGDDIWAPARGIFMIFFTHTLFKNIEQKIKDLGQSFAWNPSVVATQAVALLILSNVLDRLSAKDIGSPMTDLVSIALIPLIAMVFLKAQQAINVASDDPDGLSNSQLTLGNWVWVILGGLFWVLIMIGLYMMVVAPELLVE